MLRARLESRIARILRDDTLTQKASLNMVAAMLDYSARIVVGFVINPILVTRLGDMIFGVYQVLGRLIGYATPAGGQPSQALKWTIARDHYSSHYEAKRLEVGSALVVWFLFLPLLTVIGGTIAWFAPALVGVPENLHLTIRVAAGLLVVDLILTNLLLIPRSVLQGENLGYKRMGISTLVVLIGGALMAAAAILGTGLVGIIGSTVVTTLLSGLLYLWVTRKHVAWFGAARPRLRAVTSFLRLSGWFLAWNFVLRLIRESDVVVLGIVASPELVTVYALSRYVPEAIFATVGIALSAIMPGLGGLMGAGQIERATAVRSESLYITWLVTTAAGGTFLCLQKAFLTLWVGEQYYPGSTTTLLIILIMMQFAFIRIEGNIIDLTLRLRGKVMFGIVAAGLSIGLSVLFIRNWDLGIVGVTLGFLLGRSILSVAYPWIVSRSLGISPFQQAKGAVRPVAASAILFTGAILISPYFDARSWLVLVPMAVLTTGAFAGASFFIGLSTRQRARTWRRIRKVAVGF